MDDQVEKDIDALRGLITKQKQELDRAYEILNAISCSDVREWLARYERETKNDSKS